MAISTYSELQTAAANWLHKSASSTGSNAETLTSIIVNCIALAEERFNARLRTRFQELALSETAIDASYQVAIPSNTLAIKRIWRTGTPVTPLKPATLEYVIERQQSGDALAYAYAWEGSTWRFDGTGSVAGVLFRNIPALTDSNTTNWLLTAHPSLYLFATLAELAVYTRDMEAAGNWQAQAEARMMELNAVAQRDGFSGPLTVRAA